MNSLNLLRTSQIALVLIFLCLTATAQPGVAVYRLNCGGPDFTDWGGNLWVADTGHFNTGTPFTTASAIAETDADPLFQTARIPPAAGPEMAYVFPVTKTGTYLVHFRLAEVVPESSAPGSRVFDVALEDRVVLDDFDIVAQGGYLAAVRPQVSVWVSDGALNVEFRPEVGDPLVNGIEVRYLGTGKPQLAVTPASLDFGGVTLGQSSPTQSVTVKNDGTASVTVSALQLTGTHGDAFMVDTAVPFSLAVGATRTIGVTFAPTTTEGNAATMVLTSNAVNSPNSVGLTGTGVESSLVFTAAPASLTFPEQDVGTTSPASTVTLTNTGTASVEVTSVTLTGENAADFSVSGPALPLSLAPGATADLNLTFTPSASGAHVASLVVASSDPEGDLVVPLSGQGETVVVTSVLYRINCGGSNYTDPEGNAWSGDAGYYNTGTVYTTSASIAGTDLDPLYRVQRFDHTTAPEMMYSLPVSPGAYRVRLHFAEVYGGTAYVGARYFDVKCEGVLMLDNLDVFREAGRNAALVKELAVEVSDGTLNLEFIHQKQNPMIQGIEVLREGGQLALEPDMLDWGHVQIGASDSKSLTLTNDSAASVTVTGLAFLVDSGAGHDFSATFGGNAYAGGHEDVVHNTSVTIAAGDSLTVPVTYNPTESVENDVWLEFSGTFNTVRTRLMGSGAAHAGDPFLHVVIGVAPYYVDYDGDGSENVLLTGSSSHTHELGQTLTNFVWQEDGATFATTADTSAAFSLGSHTVSLTIGDSNSPPRTLTDSVTFRVVTPATVPGALVTYYDGGESGGAADLIDAVPANPNFAEVRPGMEVVAESGYVGGSFFATNVMVRIQAEVSIAEADTYTFQATGGLDRRLFLNGAAVTGPLSIEPGTFALEARFAVDGVAQLPLNVTVAKGSGVPAPVDPGAMTHDETQMPPVINGAPTGGPGAGGEPVELSGMGFFPVNEVVVYWGDTVLTGAQLSVTPGTIQFTSPPGLGTISVTVQTPQGLSNAIAYTYSTTAPVPVQFSMSNLVSMSAPTQAAWGNDGRLYVGNIGGAIRALTFDDNYAVTDTQTISAVQALGNNNILGIAVNPFDPPGVTRIYVAHSLLFANGGACFEGFSPYSGQISVLTGPDFLEVTPLITGLPVSNHDHGINGLEFDMNGNLLICVGGNTNAGVEHCNMGGLPESPLTAAVLQAPVWKTGFNGAITYIETATGLPNNDQVYGHIVDVASGVDVSVFAPGFRNPYDIAMTTTGRLYSTDNGPNGSYGLKSITATTAGTGPTAPDELNFTQESRFYGHANRNRGRYDNRQNTYHGPAEATVSGNFTQVLTTFSPSTNGIAEYRAQTFQGAMRGDLVTQKWNGLTYRVKLAPDGRSILSNTTLNVSLAGLDVVPGPGGVLLGIDYTGNKLVIARPVDPSATGLKVFDIFPWRAPIQGGTDFTLAGVGFGTLANTQVTIGGVPAQLASVTATRIRGVLPASAAWVTTLQDVVVTVGGVSSVLPKAFQYLLPPQQDAGAKAWFSINPGNTLLGSSTYTGGSFKITNNSTNAQRISRIEIDLSTASFPDNVFDPFGQAGDPVSKGFTPNSDPGVGVASHAFSGPHDGGYDRLEVVFNNFDPGETFTFSADVDPTSIKGAPQPGPGESGSVSGIELIGARVTVYFSDGTVRTGETFRISGSQTGSEVYVQDGLPTRPGLEIQNQVPLRLVVSSATHKVRVSGPPGAPYLLIRKEGALYTEGAVDNGYDIDPFEANTVIAMEEYWGNIGPGGFIDVPVTLTRSVPEGGYHYFRAVLKNAQGRTSALSPTVVLQYVP
ncbi:MAG: malectin domain-containing carbohydrate-binding protein [FCB group bacterium]|jgi:hypothetical protein|nr:malectin domain-containing carbohydrate-binding protein [FCB group bacterium]